MNVELKVFYPQAPLAPFEAALAAALVVYRAVDVDRYNASLTRDEELRWRKYGCNAGYRASDSERRMMDLHSKAQVTANQPLGMPDGMSSRSTLRSIRGDCDPRNEGFARRILMRSKALQLSLNMLKTQKDAGSRLWVVILVVSLRSLIRLRMCLCTSRSNSASLKKKPDGR